MSNGSIWSIDRTLSGPTTPGQSGSKSNGNERVLCIPQSSSITRASPSDCLMLYPGHSLGGVLPICRDALSVFYSPDRLSHGIINVLTGQLKPNVIFIWLFNKTWRTEWEQSILEEWIKGSSKKNPWRLPARTKNMRGRLEDKVTKTLWV